MVGIIANDEERRNRKLRQYFLFVFTAFVGLWILIYASSFFEESYKAAKNSISSERSILEKSGTIKGIYLLPFGGKIKIQGDTGEAKYTFYIIGEYKNSVVQCFMDLNNGKWKLTSHSLF